jgi:hypothetical protein
MKDLSWINHPAMEHIDPRKLAILVDLANESEGKPLEQSLPFIMNANAKLKAQNLSFSKEENELLIEVLSKDMSPQDRMKLDMMKRMIIK